MTRTSTIHVLLTAAALALAAPSVAAVPKDMTATVACWNIKGIPSITDARAERIATGLSYIDAEIIVLSEVLPHEKFQAVVDLLNEWGSDYQLIMPTGAEQPDDMKIAILFKQGVTVTDAGIIPGSNLNNPNCRNAVRAKVKIGQFDFFLIGVHLKSSRSAQDRRERSAQCAAIAAWIDQHDNGPEQDFLVVGDYNMIPKRSGHPRHDQENFEKLNPDGKLEFISSIDLADQGTHISGGRIGNLLDGYAVSAEHTQEYIDGSLRIFPLHRAMRYTLKGYSLQVSDHLPLIARFDIADEDDD